MKSIVTGIIYFFSVILVSACYGSMPVLLDASNYSCDDLIQSEEKLNMPAEITLIEMVENSNKGVFKLVYQSQDAITIRLADTEKYQYAEFPVRLGFLRLDLTNQKEGWEIIHFSEEELTNEDKLVEKSNINNSTKIEHGEIVYFISKIFPEAEITNFRSRKYAYRIHMVFTFKKLQLTEPYCYH